jgi:hypothetical protein
VLVNFGSFTFLCAIACRGWRKWKCAKMCGWVRWLFLVGVSAVPESRGLVAYNGLRLKKVGDFEAQTFF